MGSLINRLERLGHWFFYITLRLFGHKAAVILLWGVIFVYVVFSRKIHQTTRHYLSRRFIEQSRIVRWIHTFKNVFSFGQVLVERGWLGLSQNDRLSGKFEGHVRFMELIKEGNGLILLTGHVGNWQSALAHLGDLPVKVNALMQYDQSAAAKHYFDLKRGGRSFEIIDVNSEFGGMIDAMAALNRGEIVTIMGDRLVKGSSSEIDFLGESVKVPDSAYLLAASANAPVAVVFAAKTGLQSYHLKVWDYFYPKYNSRAERREMMKECSARYFKALEEYLKKYPYQWYNFYDFWKQ